MLILIGLVLLGSAARLPLGLIDISEHSGVIDGVSCKREGRFSMLTVSLSEPGAGTHTFKTASWVCQKYGDYRSWVGRRAVVVVKLDNRAIIGIEISGKTVISESTSLLIGALGGALFGVLFLGGGLFLNARSGDSVR